MDGLFDKETKEKARQGRDWRLLIVDSYGSHLNMQFVEKCDSKRILLAIFPPYATHRLQPLDVSLFSPLAIYYSQELNHFVHSTLNLCSLEKCDFFRLFWPAYIKAFSSANIASGWRRTGIYPINKVVVLDGLVPPKEPSKGPRPNSQGSTASKLSLSNWRQARKEMKVAINEAIDNQSHRFNRIEKLVTNMHLTIVLLKNENQGLQAAFNYEKKKKKRNKDIFEDLRAKDSSRSLFLSPTKVDTLRGRQTQKEKDKETEQASKQA